MHCEWYMWLQLRDFIVLFEVYWSKQIGHESSVGGDLSDVSLKSGIEFILDRL